ncbi:hypothetical protein Dda_7702 [Drechslerella dactyloides]|uniref:Uncharacterized protein n=1 Tax=Drechslerella dactyloides TaxID=74499 RepID=A0AAD6IT45_DREDA|nr:hypothetical protein Dda_7702 [Drechslerella dactyloides]
MASPLRTGSAHFSDALLPRLLLRPIAPRRPLPWPSLRYPYNLQRRHAATVRASPELEARVAAVPIERSDCLSPPLSIQGYADEAVSECVTFA